MSETLKTDYSNLLPVSKYLIEVDNAKYVESGNNQREKRNRRGVLEEFDCELWLWVRSWGNCLGICRYNL